MSNVFKELSNRLRSRWIPEREIRAETWALGGRHAGRVLEGARLEAGAPAVSIQRAILLKAVIRNEARSARALERAGRPAK